MDAFALMQLAAVSNIEHVFAYSKDFQCMGTNWYLIRFEVRQVIGVIGDEVLEYL